MIRSDTNDRLLLKYTQRIKRVKTAEELKDIDNEITFNDDISVAGYAVLMNVIILKEETLR